MADDDDDLELDDAELMDEDDIDMEAIIDAMIDDPKTYELLVARMNTPSKPRKTEADIEADVEETELENIIAMSDGVGTATENRDSRRQSASNADVRAIENEQAAASGKGTAEEQMLQYLMGNLKQESIKEDIRTDKKAAREAESAAKKEAKRFEGMSPAMIARLKQYEKEAGIR